MPDSDGINFFKHMNFDEKGWKMDTREKAADYFKRGFNCSQAVFTAFGPSLGVDEKTALKIGFPFGAGMARMQKTCGAVTGAFMAIGLKYGMCAEGDNVSRERTYRLVREFTKQFEALHGSIECRALLGADMNTEEGQKIIQSKELFKTLCLQLVKDATEITDKLLSE